MPWERIRDWSWQMVKDDARSPMTFIGWSQGRRDMTIQVRVSGQLWTGRAWAWIGGDGPLHGLVLRRGMQRWKLTWGHQWYPATTAENQAEREGDAGGACKEARKGWSEQLRPAGASRSHRHTEGAEEGERFRKKGWPSWSNIAKCQV